MTHTHHPYFDQRSFGASVSIPPGATNSGATYTPPPEKSLLHFDGFSADGAVFYGIGYAFGGAAIAAMLNKSLLKGAGAGAALGVLQTTWRNPSGFEGMLPVAVGVLSIPLLLGAVVVKGLKK